MMRKPRTTKILACWCVLSVLGSSISPAAEGPPAELQRSQPAVRDVALTAEGTLRGTLLTPNGKPHANATVVLRRGTEIHGAAQTQADGSFTMRQIRPGLYEIASERSSQAYRVWAARVAPPSAQTQAMVVEDSLIARGQQDWSPVRRALILSGVIVTSGVIGGVIGYNVKDDNSAS